MGDAEFIQIHNEQAVVLERDQARGGVSVKGENQRENRAHVRDFAFPTARDDARRIARGAQKSGRPQRSPLAWKITLDLRRAGGGFGDRLRFVVAARRARLRVVAHGGMAAFFASVFCHNRNNDSTKLPPAPPANPASRGGDLSQNGAETGRMPL